MPEIITQIGLLFYPLLGLSLIGAALIIERSIFFMRLPKLDKSPDMALLKEELKNNATLPKVVRDELMSFRLAEHQTHLMSGVHFLRTIAVLSPMLGLLGTVLGMIQAFRDIAEQTGPVAPNMIADGLWSAMLTTAYGLMIALPCLFSAFIYARYGEKRLEKIQKSLNAQSLELEGAKFS